ncbi:hypothetical protein BJ165DRAFT_1321614, partial [Panaeolus papilionaceus]
NFISKLRIHLLTQLSDSATSQCFTEAELNSLRIRNNIIYAHSTARVNYTTYDMRRDFDTINPCSHPFVMAISPETPGPTAHNAHCPINISHPPIFWYAAVLGIFHTEVQRIGSNSPNLRHQTVHFLWVRWLEPVPGHQYGRHNSELPKLQFSPEDSESAYGFLDPALVVRGCHLIPAFNDG